MVDYSFSVFLPVHNGGQYLRQCVSSILRQTYRNFDLVVLDNASDDGSLDWVNSLEDSRVSVYKAAKFLSVEESWARILDAPKNEFMTIIGHDDLFDPNYLVTMCQLIEKFPDAGLYHAHFRLVDEHDKTIRSCLPMPAIEKAAACLLSRLSFKRDSFATGYMFRSSDYERIGGIPSYKKLVFGDDGLWFSLMQNSYKATSDIECFSCRIHSLSVSYSPGWRSLYDALDCFLDLLVSVAESDREIAAVLVDELRQYMIFWYQWAYFSVRQNGEREKVAAAIQVSSSNILNILKKLGVKDAECFGFEVKKQVFGYFSRYYWFYKRLNRWVRNRLVT